MKIIEITDAKKTELAEGIEEMLRIGGRLMSCLEELGEEEGQMGMRRGGGRMGYRGGRGNGMGYRYSNNGNQPYNPGVDPMSERRGYYEDPYYV